MSSVEFTRWIAFAEVEPFGYPMDNYRMGVPTAAIVNAVRCTVPMKKGAHRPVAQSDDYLPAGKKRPPPLTKEQQEFVNRKKRGKRKK